ncbi:MAG TPA: NlpC/P60 family protein [Jatrophihabitans sp.]|jgi:hypothetical protein|uniref:C40 family peptidase n=1 Tax=Jatrophihabitans sp. TaxID=1932789 RepID=UPI002E005A4B|nr:NlpC/P60 family protein [Jatrophihabitans sp.]
MSLPTAARRPLHRLVAGLAVTAAAAAVTLAAPTAAHAAAPGPHDPFGNVSAYKAVPGGIQMSGWAVDPDARTSNVSVFGVVDGVRVTGLVPTSLPSPTVTSAYAAGPTPGYQLTIPVPSGAHVACLVAHTIGVGLDTVQRCQAVPVGTTLSSSQLAARNPVGTMKGWANPTSLHFVGWATDPDFTWRPASVVLYIDGRPAVTASTHWNSTRPLPAGAGLQSAFDILAPVAPGAHLGCVWLVNIGLGSNSFLGCQAVDTRGPAGTNAVTTPVLNAKVIAEAKTHIGQQYVWGATGPKTFDCSGLVKYSYGKFGYTTPRISEDQFTAARLIPASRAVPGDLIFTHDSVGDVYHVGIYYGPGMAVAAIDEAEGVNYQRVWDPSSTTYGSFTHT